MQCCKFWPSPLCRRIANYKSVVECTLSGVNYARQEGRLLEGTVTKQTEHTTAPTVMTASYWPLFAMALATSGSSKLPGTHATCANASLIRHRQVCIRQAPLLLLGQGDVGHLVSPWLGFAGSKRLDSLDLCADPERLHARRTRHDSSTASTFQSSAAHVHPFRTCLMTCLTSIWIT